LEGGDWDFAQVEDSVLEGRTLWLEVAQGAAVLQEAATLKWGEQLEDSLGGRGATVAL